MKTQTDTNQHSLFGNTTHVTAAPHNGTETSRVAAKSIEPVMDRLEKQVYEVLSRKPMTCDRVEVITGMSHQTASARINALARKKLIQPTGQKLPTRSGRPAMVWEVRV